MGSSSDICVRISRTWWRETDLYCFEDVTSGHEVSSLVDHYGIKYHISKDLGLTVVESYINNINYHCQRRIMAVLYIKKSIIYTFLEGLFTYVSYLIHVYKSKALQLYLSNICNVEFNARL